MTFDSNYKMKEIKTGKQVCRALVDSATINHEKKQFDVILATENPVFRRGWEENFNEVLSCDKKHIRTTRMDNGVVPLLDNHNKYEGVSRQLGALVDYKIKDGKVSGTVQFSTREEFAGIWGDIVAGIIRGVSVGYIPWVYDRTVTEGNKVPTYRATDWEPMELSLAPIPADFNSFIRSEDGNSYDIEIKNFENKNENRKMENEKTTVEGTENVQPTTQQRSADTPQAPAAVVPPTVAPAERSIDEVAAERTRAKEIRVAVRAAKLGEDVADDMIDRGININDARAEILNKLAASDSTQHVRSVNTDATAKGDETEIEVRALSDVLIYRATGDIKLEGRAADYRGMTMVDMARHMVAAKGHKAYGMSADEVIKRAIATTDYPTLLLNALDRQLKKFYESIPTTWQKYSREISVNDFREKKRTLLDAAMTLEEKPEGDEYRESKFITDESAGIKVKEYGRKITITRQAMINDDLDVFGEIPRLFAEGAAEMQAEMFWSLIVNNAKTPDGKALFHTDHKNLASAGTVLSETSLQAAKIAMARQTTPLGKRMRNNPTDLIIPVELSMLATKLINSTISPTAVTDVNTVKGFATINESEFLTDTKAWYLVNTAVEGIVHAYLNGKKTIYTDSETDFNTDNVATKARLDFGIKVWDWRGWYKNPGA